MKKLLIVGIDGMDREYILNNIEYLPNFKKIIKKSLSVCSTSVFPPDSDTAWASIYTGLNPARHGVVDFVDPLERSKINKKESEYLKEYDIIGKTFWDIAARNGKKCCLIFPHLIYPLYEIPNGFMINPHPENETLEMKPEGFLKENELHNVKVIKRIPRNKFELKKYIINKTQVLEGEFKFLERMLKKGDWDLTLFYSSVVDSIMHIFWNYCDPDDPTYPGDNKFRDVILNFHKLYDSHLGNLISALGSEYNIIIMSDHGHFRRPTNLININELLREKGYLKSVDNNKLISLKSRLKRLVVDVA